jgi:hypothetical protein
MRAFIAGRGVVKPMGHLRRATDHAGLVAPVEGPEA